MPGHQGLLCPTARAGRAGPQPEPPPFSSLRLLEGCLCCSFCRLFREAVLSLGTSDFMSICKGTHLCLLPAKGQGLGVTQIQTVSASSPAAPSCHTAPHMEEIKQGGLLDRPCHLISLQASVDEERLRPGLSGMEGHDTTPLLLHGTCPSSAPFYLLRLRPD